MSRTKVAALLPVAALLVAAVAGGLTVREYHRHRGRRAAMAEVLAGGCGAASDVDSLVRVGIAEALPMRIGCRAATPLAPAVRSFDVARVTPMRLTYLRRARQDSMPAGLVRPVRLETVIARGMRGADSAWLVRTVIEGPTGREAITDSLYFGARDLQPLRSVVSRAGASGAYTVDLRGARGTLYEKTASHGVEVAVRPDARLLVGPTTLELVLQTLPLVTGWTGSVRLLPCMLCILDWPGQRHPSMPVNATLLRVLGDARVTVPAGSFDTWRVAVSGADWPRGRTVVWVDKKSGAIVQAFSRWVDANRHEWLDQTQLTKAWIG